MASIFPAQGSGTVAARATVLNAEPAEKGLRAAREFIRAWVPGNQPSWRVERGLATVTAQLVARAAVVSIQFLRN